MDHSRLRAALVCALILGVTPAGAQTAAHAKPAAPLAESLTGPAKEAFASAAILLNNNDYAGALEKYQQAYDLSKDPRLLFNMAICARTLKRYARMQALLRRYEDEAGAAMSAAEKHQVDAALAAIQNLVGSVRLTVDEADATVSLDGQAVGATPLAAPLVVDLGSHRLRVEKPGFAPFEQQLEIEGGGETPLTAALVATRHVAQLVVAADDDATVIVDSETPTRGRFDGQLTPGAHEVVVTEPGKIPYQTQVQLQEGATQTLQVTLENEKHGSHLWPWIVGGAALAAGAVVGGYFLFKPQQNTAAGPTGQLGSLTLSTWRTR